MIKKSVLLTGLLMFFAFGVGVPAQAAMRGEQVFNDQYFVNFELDPDDAYEVIPFVGLFTDFQMAQGERILEAFLSGSRLSNWRTKVSFDERHFFVKPLQPGILNTATIITNKNTYQIRILPAVDKGIWNQRVTWNHGDEAVYRSANAAAALNAAKAFPDTTENVINLANINADYAITGTSSIRPIAVIDDGKRTKITFPASMQEMPVLFVKSADGGLSLAGWTVVQESNGTRSVTVSQLFTGAVLKLGDAKVEITNNRFPAQ